MYNVECDLSLAILWSVTCLLLFYQLRLEIILAVLHIYIYICMQAEVRKSFYKRKWKNMVSCLYVVNPAVGLFFSCKSRFKNKTII